MPNSGYRLNGNGRDGMFVGERVIVFNGRSTVCERECIYGFGEYIDKISVREVVD